LKGVCRDDEPAPAREEARDDRDGSGIDDAPQLGIEGKDLLTRRPLGVAASARSTSLARNAAMADPLPTTPGRARGALCPPPPSTASSASAAAMIARPGPRRAESDTAERRPPPYTRREPGLQPPGWPLGGRPPIARRRSPARAPRFSRWARSAGRAYGRQPAQTCRAGQKTGRPGDARNASASLRPGIPPGTGSTALPPGPGAGWCGWVGGCLEFSWSGVMVAPEVGRRPGEHVHHQKEGRGEKKGKLSVSKLFDPSPPHPQRAAIFR